MGDGHSALVELVGRQLDWGEGTWNFENSAVELTWNVLYIFFLWSVGRYSPPSRLEQSEPPHRMGVGRLQRLGLGYVEGDPVSVRRSRLDLGKSWGDRQPGKACGGGDVCGNERVGFFALHGGGR